MCACNRTPLLKRPEFFRTTTGIQSGPDAFDESRFSMTFLTILAVIEILCSFRIVLEGNTGKEIPESKIRVLRKVFSKQFCVHKPLSVHKPLLSEH